MPCNGIKRFYYAVKLVFSSFRPHGSHIRAALLTLLAATSWAGEAFGVWKLNSARSTLAGNQKSVTLRTTHTRRGVQLGQGCRGSTRVDVQHDPVLRRQGRDFQDSTCAGTQSSRRADGGTVEILRQCAIGAQARFIRRLTTQPGVPILDITEQHPDGRRSERRLVMEKQ